MVDPVARYRRSPFLLAEWRGGDLTLVQCDTQRRFLVDDRLLALLSMLDDWRTGRELAEAGYRVSAEMLGSLVGMGVIEEAPADDHAGPGRDHRWWSPFDLAVHRQQNLGPPERDVGERIGPPPAAFKARPSGPTTPLPAPCELPARLDDVLARRRSIRKFTADRVDLGALSTLLYHSARVRAAVAEGPLGEEAFRPFPAGGARSELEMYVVANRVEGLLPGAHYFDARSHELILVRTSDEYQDGMNRWVANATGALGPPPAALVVITAVFARIMWKYRWVGLGLTYADTGCLYQTLYLAATALGLGPCAVGAAPEADNARWLGLDPLVESQVGCLVLGVPDLGPAVGEPT